MDVDADKCAVDWREELSEQPEKNYEATVYYIVVDTNVLLRKLEFINDLKDSPIEDCDPPYIFIPWVVLEELDKKKTERGRIAYLAREAIWYIYIHLKRRHPKIIGQSPIEVEQWEREFSKNNDDKILECCIGLNKYIPQQKIILLTNDINFYNKGTFANFIVLDPDSLMQKMNLEEKQRIESFEIESPFRMNDHKILQRKKEKYKGHIHNIMSNVHQLLKKFLIKLLCETFNKKKIFKK